MSKGTIYDRALTLLGFRARSVSELRRQLLRGGASASDVEDTIARLQSQRLLNDADFARQYARTRLTGTGTSRRRVVQELARKGVSRDVAEDAVRDVIADEGIEPGRIAFAVAAKKWNALSGLDDFTRRRRVYAFLARRGFDPDEIRQVMSGIGAHASD